jgi:hypothetical protein
VQHGDQLKDLFSSTQVRETDYPLFPLVMVLRKREKFLFVEISLKADDNGWNGESSRKIGSCHLSAQYSVWLACVVRTDKHVSHTMSHPGAQCNGRSQQPIAALKDHRHSWFEERFA